MKDNLIETQLGGYTVRGLLGSGGMARVYKGYDPALDREVAIKVISTAGQPPDFISRFQREARVVARLRHPNIVQIYHFGDQEDIVYMVQELLPGPTLERRIREAGRRRIAAERVHTIVAELAGALDFAHRQGVIHRDVKPSNALYNGHGQLVLTDFGIARSTADSSRTATGPGVVMGTPGYIAPEQAISSAALTPACDVYSLGVVLFELLTGQLPFAAETPMGVVLKHLYDDPPPPSSLRPDLPKPLDAVVLRALRKEPDERYPSAGALAEALRAAWPTGRGAPSATGARPKSTQPKSASTPPPTPAAPAAARPTPQPTPKPRAAAVSSTPTPRRNAARATPKPTPATPSTTPAPSRSPARAATRKDTAPPAPVPPSHRNQWRLRVGLITADIVGALLLFGARPDALAEAWREIMRLLGS